MDKLAIVWRVLYAIYVKRYSTFIGVSGGHYIIICYGME